MAINAGLLAPCFSQAILEEYSDVLLRPRFGFPAEEIGAVLDLMRTRGNLVEAAPIARLSPDPEDDKFIACALEAQADFLVTGNKRHFPPSREMTVQVVNAAEFLEYITLEL